MTIKAKIEAMLELPDEVLAEAYDTTAFFKSGTVDENAKRVRYVLRGEEYCILETWFPIFQFLESKLPQEPKADWFPDDLQIYVEAMRECRSRKHWGAPGASLREKGFVLGVNWLKSLKEQNEKGV